MAAIVVLGVIALAGAVVAWVTWRRGTDERESVQHHQHTLETLRHVADRRPQTGWPAAGTRRPPAQKPPTSRPAPPSGRTPRDEGHGASAPTDAGAARARRPVSARRATGTSPAAKESAKVHARRRETLLFSDEHSDAAAAVPNNGPRVPARRPSVRLPGAAEQARREGRARVQRTRIIAAGAVVVVVGAVVGALTLGGSTPSPRPAHDAARPITAAGHARVTTPTTQASSDLVPSSPTAYSATYAAPSTAYTVVVEVSGACWVMATDPSSGRVVWTGTLAPGASQTLSVSGALALHLGAPTDARVTLDGRPVQLPPGYRAPFDLSFAPDP